MCAAIGFALDIYKMIASAGDQLHARSFDAWQRAFPQELVTVSRLKLQHLFALKWLCVNDVVECLGTRGFINDNGCIEVSQRCNCVCVYVCALMHVRILTKPRPFRLRVGRPTMRPVRSLTTAPTLLKSVLRHCLPVILSLFAGVCCLN